MSNLFLVMQIIALLLTFVAIALVIHMDGSNAQKMMVCFMMGVLVQNAGNLFEALSRGPGEALVAIKLQYLGACFVPLFFGQFIFIYCNQYRPKWLFNLLGLISLLVMLSVWTCDYHSIFYKEMRYVSGGTHPHYEFSYGIGFWVFIILGALMPFGLAVFALIRAIFENNYQRRKKHYIMVIALAVIPTAALLLRAGQLMKDYDLVPPVLAIVLSSVVIVVWSRHNYDLSHAAADVVLYTTSNGVIFLDDEQKIVGFNPAAEKIFEDMNKKMVGKTITKIQSFPEKIISEKGKQEFSIDDRYFEGYMEPVIDKDNTLLGYIILIFNITESKRLMMESMKMRERAEAANRAKSEFMAAMSHEMRTPMNAIVGFAELIKEESLGRKVYQYACDIKDASGRLLEIFDDIWDMSSMEAGKLEIIPKDYNIRNLLRNVSEKAETAAKEKGLLYSMTVDESLPVGYFGDQDRVKQVLDHVLDNAVKFTDIGRISLTVEGEKRSKEQVLLRFIITDTGIGIEEKNLQKIFYNFEQVDSSESRNADGTGIGLSVSKNIVELMGGTLGVESQIGKGSTFTICIPQDIRDEKTIGESIKEAPDQKEEPVMFSAPDCHILIVDDNLINRKIAQGMLKDYGFQIDEAESGQEAIDLVKEQKYDIIFMDHMMPEMDGMEATGIIRKECGKNGEEAVVVALTANAMKGAREMFLSNGFQDFVVKPIDRMLLHNVLSKWIPDEKKESAIAQVAFNDIGFDEIEGIFVKGINIKKVMEQHAGNLSEYLDILNLFYLDGMRKTELIQKLKDEKDYENYKIEVHGLKSASANIGAQDLSKQAEFLETAAASANGEFIDHNHDSMIESYKKLLSEIKNLLDKRKIKEQQNNPKEALEKDVILKSLGEALEALEHFKSKDAKDKLERLLEYDLQDKLYRSIQEIQNKLQLYEDEEAEELLRNLIQKYSDGKE